MAIRVIPVLDLKGGVAVRARAGDRDHYAPLSATFHPGSDPVEWASAFRTRLGLDTLYLADLDAITRGMPQLALIRRVIETMREVWLDGGFRVLTSVSPWRDDPRVCPVLGLETIAGPEAVKAIVDAFGAGRVIFSLDLRDGVPLADERRWGALDATRIIGQVIDAGVRRVILLDLKRVGVGRGPGTLDLLGRLATHHPNIEWTVGGGVSTKADLDQLAETPACAILVGTAIYDRTLT